MRHAIAVCLLTILTFTAGRADAWETVGIARLLSNDDFATLFDDRWRTGSGTISVVRARTWDGALPSRMGDLIEFRFRGEIMAPSSLTKPRPVDRPYAQHVSFGVHTHFDLNGIDMRLGGDLVITGPQTRLDKLQQVIHDVIGVPGPGAVLPRQIPNGFHGMVSFEAGRRLDLSPNVTLRPFVELQAGVETLARAGADFHFGQIVRDEFLLRDVSSGQRYRVRRAPGRGWAAVLGADLAYLHDSIFLPSSSGVSATKIRARVRTGVHWQGRSVGVFYGLTYLTKEFDAQPEGQVLGAIRLDVLF